MRKLHKFLIMTVLVAMLVGLGSIASSAAATATPVKVLADFDGEASAQMTGGTSTVVSKSGNKYYSVDFTSSGANLNFGGSNYAFLGKGDYIITEFDFMAEDWSTMSNMLIGWNSRNSSGGALNDMHFSFTNDKGVPKISGTPLSGSITLDPTPGVWHHFTLVVKVGGEHVVKSGSNLTAVQGQDAVEAYAYVDGVFFAKNLIGDGKEFWSKDTTFFQTLRVTANGSGARHLNMDNIRVVQYEETRELREFFKYRSKNNGAFPDLNAVSYPFLAYDADYSYPLGTPNCKVVELNGNEVLYDRFDKACKYASTRSGAKIVLLAPVADAKIQYPVKVDRAGFTLGYTLSPSLRVEEIERVNPITGETSKEISFIKKTKYAFYKWAVDHTGEVFDSRGYSPLAVGTPVAYDGEEFASQYYRDGVLYTFTGNWMLDGVALGEVPVYAANSFYTLYPEIRSDSVFAIIEDAEGGVQYALNATELASMVAAAAQDSVVTFVKDIALDASLVINKRIVLDLAGNDLTVAGANAFLLAQGARGTVITSSVAGSAVTSGGSVFEAACAFTFDGANILAKAASLIKVDAAVSGVVIDGGVFVLSGEYVLALGEEASLSADINATVFASALLADASLSYDVTLGGAFLGVTIPASELSTVILSEGLALTDASSFTNVELPEGVALAAPSLVIAAKKQAIAAGDATADAYYVVADAADVAHLIWAEGIGEYVAIGETVYYDYADYYDAKLFYRHSTNRTYAFVADGVYAEGNVVEEAFAGLTIEVDPFYDSMSFYLVAVKPDGTCVPYTAPADLTALMESGEYEDGTVFAIGKKNVISIENLDLRADYALDLNGYALSIFGINEINGGSLKIYSSVAGAALGSDLAQAFALKNGATLEIDGANLGYYGKTLANVDATSALKIAGGVFAVTEGDFYKTEAGATVEIRGIAANAELFAAEAGYAWVAVEEATKLFGVDIVVRYDVAAE